MSSTKSRILSKTRRSSHAQSHPLCQVSAPAREVFSDSRAPVRVAVRARLTRRLMPTDAAARAARSAFSTGSTPNAADHEAIELDRAGQRALLLERAGRVIAGAGEDVRRRGRVADHRLERADALRRVPFCQLQARLAVARGGIAGAQREGPVEGPRGLGQCAALERAPSFEREADRPAAVVASGPRRSPSRASGRAVERVSRTARPPAPACIARRLRRARPCGRAPAPGPHGRGLRAHRRGRWRGQQRPQLLDGEVGLAEAIQLHRRAQPRPRRGRVGARHAIRSARRRPGCARPAGWRPDPSGARRGSRPPPRRNAGCAGGVPAAPGPGRARASASLLVPQVDEVQLVVGLAPQHLRARARLLHRLAARPRGRPRAAAAASAAA